VFAPLAVSAVDAPVHIVADEGVMLTVGSGFTVMVTVVKFVQPAAVVPVTVYVVVAPGVAVTVAPVVWLSPVAGDQVYVAAPLAVKLVDPPMQIVDEEGVTVIVGTGFTVTVTVAVPVQPLAVVPVTE
jgi:hypothetical protein